MTNRYTMDDSFNYARVLRIPGYVYYCYGRLHGQRYEFEVSSEVWNLVRPHSMDVNGVLDWVSIQIGVDPAGVVSPVGMTMGVNDAVRQSAPKRIVRAWDFARARA